jgi:hypothetical protein
VEWPPVTHLNSDGLPLLGVVEDKEFAHKRRTIEKMKSSTEDAIADIAKDNGLHAGVI